MARLPRLLLGGLLCFVGCAAPDAPVTDYALHQPHLDQVRVRDGFWAARMDTNRTVTIPHTLRKNAETGRVLNLEIAAGLAEGKQTGRYPFNDSDVYKAIEAASMSLIQHPDPVLEARLDSLIILIGAAQEPDGYLYTWRTNQAVPGDTVRWSDLRWGHELYNLGHLFEAAVAHHRATGKRSLLDIALKSAALVRATFGPDQRRAPPGHQEIEIGLVKLYRLTGDQAYLDLARFFIDERGRYHDGRAAWGTYAQDHAPFFEQDEAVGHAVRAAYYYAAIADVATLTGDERYIRHLDALFDDVTGTKMYVTGGTGAVGFGERYGAAYELPNFSGYSETCSSIGNVFWLHRMFRHSGDARYLDVMERTLYNALLAGHGLEGNRFFYPNVLASRGFDERYAWFVCPCCVANLGRFLAALPSHLYSYTDDAVYATLYAGSEATLNVGGTSVTLTQTTDYPWSGTVQLALDSDAPAAFALHLRLPGWTRDTVLPGTLYRFTDEAPDAVRIQLNGAPIDYPTERGFAVLRRTWEAGDVVTLTLPMPVRRIVADDRVTFDRERMALQRGPLVYALEGPDQPDGHALHLVVDPDAPITATHRPDLLGGVTVLQGPAQRLAYAESGKLETDSTTFTAIPYYAWAHRGRSEMTVWIATTPAAAEPLHAPPLSATAEVATSSGQPASGLGDGTLQSPVILTADSSGTRWITYRFDAPREVSAADVLWYDNGAAVRVPVVWHLEAWVEDHWERPYNPDDQWPLDPEAPNRAIFETFRTDRVRLVVEAQPGADVGVRSWVLY